MDETSISQWIERQIMTETMLLKTKRVNFEVDLCLLATRPFPQEGTLCLCYQKMWAQVLATSYGN